VKKILITGAAGFIGFHLVTRLLTEKYEITGLDNINDYYDVNLKLARLKEHGIGEQLLENQSKQSSLYPQYKFIKADIANFEFIVNLMKSSKFDYVVNLAAQAGVRYSIENPRAYTHSNIDGFLSILEGCRWSKVKHLIYASTSSVYGLNTKMPLDESMPTEHPMALYAATKKANEMMAHSYSHLFRLPTTGLRFFTVYGPWGRPDMAIFLFTEAIYKGKSIDVFNGGQMIRDFTYVKDIVEAIYNLIEKPSEPNLRWNSDIVDISTSSAPYRIFNIGNSTPILLEEYISELEKAIGIKAKRNYLPIQPGDVLCTHSNNSKLNLAINYKPNTAIKDGVGSFVEWYKNYIVTNK
jgi:UDP-glucuronate 4-epimerase